MTKKVLKRISVMLLAVMCFVSMGTVGYAAETPVPQPQLVEFTIDGNSELEVNVSEDGKVSLASARGLSGYNQTTFSGNSTSLNVYVGGSYSFGAGMTIKATSPNSSAWGYVSVYKPNGTLYKNSVYVDCNSEKFIQMYGCDPGTYRIVPSAWYNPAGSVRIQVWIYA